MLSLVPVVGDLVCIFDLACRLYLVRIPVFDMLVTVQEITVSHLLLNVSKPSVVAIVFQIEAVRVMTQHFHGLFKLIHDLFAIKFLDFL